ncbi:MAG TPA: T9SS type A sorting domain-containing protein [Chitinophagales bacterium]|nr:T9SS type A sorting domain-containing protein [Chitinophagales bacterium]
MNLRLLSTVTLLGASVAAFGQMPNGNMEAWTTYTSLATGVTCDVPDQWDVPDKIAADLGITDRNCTKETVNVHGGAAAARLETKSLNVLGTPLDVPGTITTGIIGFDFITFTPSVEGGASVSSNYDAVTGYYQYAPSGSDTMNVIVYMIAGTDTIGVGQYRDETTSAAYQMFNCPITYTGVGTADKMQITITSSGGFTSLVPGSVLFVDDLAVTGGAAIDDWSGYAVSRNIYPNPAQDYININNPAQNSVMLEVFSMTGQRVDVQTLSPEMNTINLESYASGIYSFRLVDNGVEVYSNKFVVKK